jgi:hypothetical protein
MNYELKSISPGSVFWNALRIFLVVGFIVAILEFFVISNARLAFTAFWQKAMATILFTLVYAAVISVIASFIAWLYNFWATRFKGVTIHFEQE